MPLLSALWSQAPVERGVASSWSHHPGGMSPAGEQQRLRSAASHQGIICIILGFQFLGASRRLHQFCCAFMLASGYPPCPALLSAPAVRTSLHAEMKPLGNGRLQLCKPSLQRALWGKENVGRSAIVAHGGAGRWGLEARECSASRGCKGECQAICCVAAAARKERAAWCPKAAAKAEQHVWERRGR
jgi:hypothetical protein